MKLEPLCRLSMRYVESAWARPFGGEEGAGWGSGDGTVTGDVLRGTLRWSNYPRRREDGVWTPNVRGVIATDDGASIMLSMHGQSVEQSTETGLLRAILVRLEFLTDDARYRWINTVFAVAEGEIDEDTEEIWFDAFVCVNDKVAHAPAIGERPPDQFRQG
jgi:hypothetical protein